jgi:PAS domain-containing protein
MTGVTAEQISMEEKLYARSQLLSRLSDALPVGVFQVNMAGHVTFTNDRLHVIVGVGLRATIAEQMASITDEDRPLFEAALATAFAERPATGTEPATGNGCACSVCGPSPTARELSAVPSDV